MGKGEVRGETRVEVEEGGKLSFCIRSLRLKESSLYMNKHNNNKK